MGEAPVVAVEDVPLPMTTEVIILGVAFTVAVASDSVQEPAPQSAHDGPADRAAEMVKAPAFDSTIAAVKSDRKSVV